MSDFFRAFRNVSLILSLASTGTALAAATNPQISVRPKARIVAKVDNAKLAPLANTHPSVVSDLADLGRVSSNTIFSHMTLVLKSSDEQEFALQQLLDQQQDKGSANYHQWLTPETFGANFGVASSDLAQVTAWLQDSGFTIDNVTKGARIIQFSGTAGQVEAAFHTEMHNYMLNGETRIANATDISLPAALTPVVAGVARLNNFPLHANLVGKRTAIMGKDGQIHDNGITPDYTSLSSGSHYVGAADLATIFDTNPLLSAGINGKGIHVAILGQTDILQGDISAYRALFNLPPNPPNFIQVGQDPGTIADDGESDLDVELSGGIAPMATIDFYKSGNSYFGGGIDASGVYVVEQNSDDIISLSYGECELSLGSSGNAFYSVLWEQAASQGISVFVSSGDSGPAVCDSSSNTYARNGYNVSGLSGTPYNVSVGGTMFDDNVTGGGAVAPYWGPGGTAPYSSALSYIPEIPWNEGRFDKYPNGFGGIVSGSSGVSFYYGIPAYQSGYGFGVADPKPNSGSIANNYVVPGPHRLQPDVSLEAAAGHDGTIFCSEGSCLINSDGTVGSVGLVGGTSVAAPSMAGVQALIDQKNGGRQGNPNYIYYRAANVLPTTPSATQHRIDCTAATYNPAANCNFHDIATGNNNIPTNSSGTTYIGWSAGPGYDPAVGLGSPDVANLANNWSSITFNATTTAFTLTPTTSAHGATYNITLAVNPVNTSLSQVPTGDISIIASVASGGVGFYTLASGSNKINGTLTGLPAGTYNVYAHYTGDTFYGGSNSPAIQVTVSAEGSQVNNTSYLLATNGGLSATTTFTYGANVYIDSGVSSPSGIGTPTGTITYTLTPVGGTALAPTVASLDSFDDTYFDAGLGYAGYDIAPTHSVLPTGTYTVATAYSGDSTFSASTGTPFQIVIGPISQTLTLRAASTEVASAAPATLTASITTISPAAGGVPATGTVTFNDTTTNTVLGTGTMSGGIATITTNLLVTNGAHVITATYSGDANYQTKTSTSVTVTVGGTATTTGISFTVGGVSASTAQVGTTVTLVGAVASPATGTVYFYDNGLYLGNATLSTTTHTASLAVSTFTAGTHPITAVYTGNSTLDTSTSAVLPLSMTQNTPLLQLTTQANGPTGTQFSMNTVLTPSPAGTKPDNPAPTGNIQFLDAANGAAATTLGTAVAAYLPGGYQHYVASFSTAVLVPGYHVLSATYVGDQNYAQANSNTQAISIGLTTTTISTSTTSVGTGVPFTLTATVTPVVPTTNLFGGTVSFYDTTSGVPVLIGTATVSTAGVAKLTTATLTGASVHTIAATYSGNANFYTSSTTSSLSVTALTPGFSLSASPTALTIERGTSGSTVITATSYGNYTGTGPLSCIGLPANSYCTFTVTAYTFNGVNGTQTSNLSITTLNPHSVGAIGQVAGFLWLPAGLLAGFLGLRRKHLSARMRHLTVFTILLFGMLATTGCSSLSMATPFSTTTVTVIANGVPGNSASPAIQPTVALTVTVTP